MIRLHRIGAWVFIAALMISSTGCLIEQHTLKINQDGSADLNIHYGMADRTIALLNSAKHTISQLPSATNTPATTEFKNPYEFDQAVLESWFKPFDTSDITLTSVNVESRNAWTYTTMTIHFHELTDIERLNDHPLLANHRYSLLRNDAGIYTLTHQFNHHQAKASVDINNPDTRKNLTPILAGMNVSVSMEIPGTIKQTNSQNKNIRTATWDYSFDKNPKSIEKIQTDTRLIRFTNPALRLPDFDLKHSDSPQK